MKNLFFLGLIFGLIRFSAVAQLDTIYYEPFADSIPAQWSQFDSTNNNFDWVHTTVGWASAWNPASVSSLISTSANDGWIMLHADYYNTDTATMQQADSIIYMNATINSTPYDFSSESSVFLSLQHYYRTLSLPKNGSLEMNISNDGVNWTTYDLHTGGDQPANVQNGVENLSIDISSIAANQPTVWVQFHFREVAWYFWNIDDLLFTRQDPLTVSTTEVSNEALQVYPNPTTNLIHISGITKSTDYVINDLKGTVLSKGLTSGSIDVSSIKEGVYLLKLGSEVISFVKE